MDSIIRDIRYGVRGLLKHPGFTAIVVITLALGIGASTAIFSVVNSVVLRPLPYRTAERIVAIRNTIRTAGEASQPPLTSTTGASRTPSLNIFPRLRSPRQT